MTSSPQPSAVEATPLTDSVLVGIRKEVVEPMTQGATAEFFNRMTAHARALERALAASKLEVARIPSEEQKLARRIALRVAEFPDRNSPDDQPEMMLVTPDELRAIVLSELDNLSEQDTPVVLAATLPPVERNAGEREAALEDMEARKDAAYLERNHLVAALARLFPSGLRRTDIPGWSPDWHGCCMIDLPSGQISYHFHDSHAHLFAGLPPYTKEWDGHDKDAVHERLRALKSQANEG